MWDAAEESWRFRQTGLMIEIPELWGRLFIGRTKEGISMNKIMVGYQGWTMERATANDAFVPILADGVKWMGNSPGGSFLWSLGWFGDRLSEDESFNKFDTQAAVRGVWLPLAADAPDDELLHLGLGYRWAKSNDGFFQFKSKPESFPAQSFAIDTGKLPGRPLEPARARGVLPARSLGVRLRVLPAPGELEARRAIRSCTAARYSRPIWSPERLVRTTARAVTSTASRPRARCSRADGARGSSSVVSRTAISTTQAIEGGTFWRITPMVNWYLTDNIRLEFTYGYGVLDRFGIKGGTQFFGTRIQFQL